MYAVIKTGGKQYRVSEGQLLKIESISGESGESISFDKVLMIKNESDVSVGSPFIEGAKVVASVVSHGRHPKVKILKFRRRKHHMKRMGHRQNFTQVKIESISA